MCDSNSGATYAAAKSQAGYYNKPVSDGHEEARALARLLERELGLSPGIVGATTLRLMIRAYWGRISKLAHTIHEAD